MAKNVLDVLCKLFHEELTAIFGDHVESVILFGSAAGPDYLAGLSDHNFLVVLDEEAIGQLDKVRPLVGGWRKRRIAPPLFMTPGYIRASLDSFPMEFLNMRFSYRVILGKDVLADLEIAHEDLRLQAEREVKGYLLKLRQGSILSQGKAVEMRRLIVDSLPAFTSLFRTLLFLKKMDVPATRQAVRAAAAEALGLDQALFDRLYALRAKEEKADKATLDALLRDYIREVARLGNLVDTLSVE